MEYIREWWDVAWQWLLGSWQWLLALPWVEWWDILGNVATVLGTIWSVVLGREFVAPGRWTILYELYARMEGVHWKIMNLQRKAQIQASDFEDLMSLRNDMKNYFHDNRFMFSQNLQVLVALEVAVSSYGDNIKDYEKTHIQYTHLRGMLEQLIHQRNVLQRFFHFLFIGVWVGIWRWLWRPRGTRSVK